MTCNYKQKLVIMADATQLSAYAILYSRALLKEAVKVYKKPATIKKIVSAVINEFNRLEQEEFYNNEERIVSAIIGYEDIIKHLELREYVDYRQFRVHVNDRDKNLRNMWETMLCILTICYWNTVDDFVKTEEKKIAIAKVVTAYFVKECKNGLFNFRNNGRAFAKWICDASGYEVKI